MVRVGLGLYKYSIAYRLKHSITNGLLEANESNSVVVPQTVSFFTLLMWWMCVSLLEDAGVVLLASK